MAKFTKANSVGEWLDQRLNTTTKGERTTPFIVAVWPGRGILNGCEGPLLQSEKWEPVFGSDCEATKKDISRDQTYVCQV